MHGGSADLTKPPAAARKGLALDSQFLWLHTLLTRVYLAQLRPREALAKAERDTAPVFHLQDLALGYHALAQSQESDRAPAELISTYKATAAFQIAEVYAFGGEVDAAFVWLDRAYVQRDAGLTFTKGDPLLASPGARSRLRGEIRNQGVNVQFWRVVEPGRGDFVSGVRSAAPASIRAARTCTSS